MAYVPAPGYQPIYNPPLPHAVPIAGGLRPGMSIYVQGMVPHHTKRFRVNFSCGPEKGANIALHFNPRFDSGDKIVLNSFQRGNWAKEEHKHDMPFHKGQHFEMVFNITPEGYRITVNGAPCYEFRHRIPPEHVQVVDVDGDLELQSLNVIGGGMMGGGGMYYPQPGMLGMQPNMPPTSLPMMAGPASFHPVSAAALGFALPFRSRKEATVRFLPQLFPQPRSAATSGVERARWPRATLNKAGSRKKPA
ncbi:galectin-4, partial [Trachemys scripta elegans]|uniref:galectin-4 n=1 Tax=Trachemys scripta elegans TaxID=31138 RepID=UPI00155344EC